MLLLYYYVPEMSYKKVNQALFDIGLGSIGNYDSCCWVTPGQGQFRPLKNSNPHIGQTGKLEYVNEFKVEMICPPELKEEARRVLLKNHPYETPAYGFLKVIH